MRRVVSLAALVLLATPPRATAQTWRELYDRGEYQQAALLLHPLVIDAWQDPDVRFPDPEATERLGLLYAEGRGVARDAIAACAFFQLASRGALDRYHFDDHPVVARLDRRREVVCQSLAPDERTEALEIMSCPTFGLDRQAFSIDAGYWIEVSRRGIRVHYKDQEQLDPIPMACGRVFPLVRHTRVDPPAGAIGLSPRHVLEIFAWAGGPNQGAPRRSLTWFLLEIIAGSLQGREAKLLTDETGSRWSHPPVPSEFIDVSFQMLRDGQLRWRFDGSRLAGLVERLPVEAAPEPPDEFPPVVPGSGRIEVKVTDRFGGTMQDVTVRLNGLVSRELTTDGSGAGTFEDLEGRFDVAASAKGFMGSVPRVVDVSAWGILSIEIVLKPAAPTVSVSISCGPAAPRTLEALAAEADAVVHLQIERRHSYRWASPSEPERMHILTNFETRWIESFRASSRVAPGDEIVQRGGRIDDGEQIESAVANPRAPLNVGDEYVLFLKRYEHGSMGIHHGPEGAFRIRNGRVEPLGRQELAGAWKGRRADRFLEALRTKLKAGGER